MKYFPFYMELSKKSVLLIGGGEVAERKLDLLLKANAKLTIISPELGWMLVQLSAQGTVRVFPQSAPELSQRMDNDNSIQDKW